ncbi:MAG: 5-(carboxyamino)imidazole ribonucleotide mutase [Bacteriovoracaceae bacterium]|nr:5-(carboxyamino)imidazole ribonucleotide mutase [Bacteriovoracaceae bacterium]
MSTIFISVHTQVAIIMGSDSDWRIMRQAFEVLESFEISCHKQVLSAHRTPEDLSLFAKACEAAKVKVIIAGAGGAAHLPGMMAAFTIIPVIGVPINTTSLQGLDALYSVVQMPKGIPVATVAIDQATNAGILATQILASFDEELKEKILAYRHKMKQESREKTKNLI